MYHSTLGSRVIKKKKGSVAGLPRQVLSRSHRGEYFWNTRFRGSPIRCATKITTQLLWDVTGIDPCELFFAGKSYLPEILDAMSSPSLLHTHSCSRALSFSRSLSPPSSLFLALSGVRARALFLFLCLCLACPLSFLLYVALPLFLSHARSLSRSLSRSLALSFYPSLAQRSSHHTAGVACGNVGV